METLLRLIEFAEFLHIELWLAIVTLPVALYIAAREHQEMAKAKKKAAKKPKAKKEEYMRAAPYR